MAEIYKGVFEDDKGNRYYAASDTEITYDTAGIPLNNGGDLSEASVNFTVSSSRKALTAKARFKALMGDIAKWLTDLGPAAFYKVADDFTTTAENYLFTARKGKQLKDEVDNLNQNLGGYKFSVIDGIPSYKVGADTAWVPLGSGIYYIADYGELAAYGTSPKTYTIPVPDYVKSRVAASVYNNADNYVGLADTAVGIAPGGIPGNHHHPSTLTVNDGVITITVGAKGASYYVQPRGKIYLVTGSIIKA